MKQVTYILFFLLFVSSLRAQTSLSHPFFQLSRPEKIWVIGHPFKAKKAFLITKRVQKDVDSIKNTGSIGSDNNGGKLDAFKHAYWMACVAHSIGNRRAKKLGIAHEKGNKIQFKKHQLEDNALPDSLSSVMDLHNNKEGIKAVSNCKKTPDCDIQKLIMEQLNLGKLQIFKKDIKGNFLNCEGAVIILKDWYGKWNIPKCLVSSNEG